MGLGGVVVLALVFSFMLVVMWEQGNKTGKMDARQWEATGGGLECDFGGY